MPANEEVVLAGVPQFKKALKEAEPEYLKALNREIRVIGNALAEGARQLVPDKPPMSGWSLVAPENPRTRGGAGWPVWDTAAMRKSITFVSGGSKKAMRNKRAGFKPAYSLKEENAAAVIFDWAGKGAGNGTGVQFLANIRARAGANRFRVMVRYLGTNNARATAQHAIAEAIKAADNKLQARI